jgi:tetratricopeptide (TPR) repeat protein
MPLQLPSSRLTHCLALLGMLGAMASVRADDASAVHALVLRGQMDQALLRAEKAAVANPRNAQAQFLHGVVLMDMARDEQALAVFTALAQEYPELPEPPNNIALLHARQGRLELARQWLEVALRNDPTHRLARANLGQIYLMLAVQSWEQAAATGALDVALQRRLEAARALLNVSATPAR